MKYNWENITREDVLKAIEKFKKERPDHPEPRNTYLIHKGKKYPAKHIRGMAYYIANGVQIKKNEYSGGEETVRFFEKRGFKTEYKKRIKPVDFLETFDWRSLELEFQRVRLNYIKWLFYFSPPVEEIYQGSGIKGDYIIFNSPFGRSFSLFPCGIGSVYVGSGKGCVGLPPKCFKKNKDLKEETTSIIHTLPEFIRELRVTIKEQLELGNMSLVWEMIQNYYWIKFGMHEYIFDISFDPENDDNEITEHNTREYVNISTRQAIDLSKKLPKKFSDQDIYKLLSYNFTWNRYAICSYDCGPICWGKDGYVPFSVISKTRKEYHRANLNLLDDIYNNKNLTSIEEDNAVREYAVKSLKNLCDFKILYHKTPIADSYIYQDFLKHKREIRELIIDTQESINQVIEEEHLLLEKHHFEPE